MTQKNGEDRICPTCGNNYHVPLNVVIKGLGKSCSWNCRFRTPEQRKQLSITGKAIKRKPLPHAYKKGNVPWNKGLKGCFSEEVLDKIRKYRASQILPTNDTSIERIMKAELDKLGFIYRHPFNLDDRFVLDFAFPEVKVGIECDGEYWHKQPRNIRSDKMKNGWCKAKGWILLRFPEETIIKDMNYCKSVIMETLRGTTN